MARAIQVAFDCVDPDRLASFWADVLAYRVLEPPEPYASWSAYSDAVGSEPDEAWIVLVDPDGRGPSLLFHRVREPKVAKNRVHLDVRLSPGAAKVVTRPLVDAEVRRLVALGASHVRTTEDDADYYAVMQDPEGNEFCIG